MLLFNLKSQFMAVNSINHQKQFIYVDCHSATTF